MKKVQGPKSKTQISRSGFTLVESLVAITILLIGILGPLGMATRGITDGFYAQNQLMAVSLAREGLEFLSTRIDENLRITTSSDTPVPFLNGLENCDDDDYCAVELNENSLVFSFIGCDNPLARNCQLAYNTEEHIYKPYDGNFSPGSPIFTRRLKVNVLEAGDPSLVLLSSVVTWLDKPGLPPREVFLDRLAVDRIYYE